MIAFESLFTNCITCVTQSAACNGRPLNNFPNRDGKTEGICTFCGKAANPHQDNGICTAFDRLYSTNSFIISP